MGDVGAERYPLSDPIQEEREGLRDLLDEATPVEPFYAQLQQAAPEAPS